MQSVPAEYVHLKILVMCTPLDSKPTPEQYLQFAMHQEAFKPASAGILCTDWLRYKDQADAALSSDAGNS